MNAPRAYLAGMPFARALLLVLTALLLAFGGQAGMATAMPAGEPPCHETPATPEQPDLGKATGAVSCCVGCMPAAQALDAPPAHSAPAREAIARTAARPLQGLALAPDPRPPRA